ncbi:DUF3616 domain-containing protein [Streptosporangium carneum]|uniref:DUF3616 domain-containing protein n=1 Tax=Streptosporangium carneum TaxID=47481 RepID=A0A9W6MFI2_9ACTN|nr:DUF3616 domain-containing protein [Streptosporangium carneum]GLK12147.1 hypothetical protein GCM10017600_55550 [Streptosporangium carneum]
MHAERQIELRFHVTSREARTHTNLSAVRSDGLGLWLAGDETATVEHLTLREGRYDEQLTYALADFVDLPAGPEDEADIEGLARTDGWLWAIGSHSLKRKRVRRGHPAGKARRRLGSVVREENRYILVRLPLVGSVPVRADGGRTAAILSGRGRNLADLMIDDPHLAPFLKIPSKDNGLDVEGIAVLGDRMFVGLRGPVLRGWAVLLEIRPETDPRRPDRLLLAPIDGEPYRTHFLNLGGLGVRDLCPHGDDLLILAGPTMDLDGPVRLLRWRPGSTPSVEHDPEFVMSLPHGEGDDHAEGIAVLDGERLLVVYDSPSDTRLTPEGGVLADIVSLPLA